MRGTYDYRNLDCMIGMKDYPDKYFELAIVDPPYRDENQPTKDMRANGSMKSLTGRPPKEYWDELCRCSKNQIVWGANNFQLPQWKGFIVWKKHIPEDFTMSMCEIAALSEGISTISKFVEIPSNGEQRIHPTQKPIMLYKWLLKNYATCKYCQNEGGIYEDVVGDGGSRLWIQCDECDGAPKILDTHVGSGSSIIAAIDYGFHITGFELDPDYYAASLKRIRQHESQLTLI